MVSRVRPSGGLEGYAVLVTGGGTGIGAACAAELAADGAAVTICGRTEQRLVDGGQVDFGARAGPWRQRQTVVADVTVEDEVAALVAAALEADRVVERGAWPTPGAAAAWGRSTYSGPTSFSGSCI